jgi:hypothetical protein
MKRSFEFRFSRHSPESGPPAKASGRSRWAFASMVTLPTPFTAYSKGPGLTELLRLYVCGLQPGPSVQLSSSRVIANDNEYFPELDLGASLPAAAIPDGFYRGSSLGSVWIPDRSIRE